MLDRHAGKLCILAALAAAAYVGWLLSHGLTIR
jgi:hypothetical protein